MDFALSWWHYPVILLVVIFSMIIAGYLDRRIGFLREEQRFYTNENPIIQDIVRRLKEIEKETKI